MPAALPPMTTRQARRLGKKNPGQLRYSASQMRRADRREELEGRRQKEQEKERKKKENKRKREEQNEKERDVKRQLLREGKIAEEDTWGKVTASQPRLSNFFKAPTTVNRPRSAPAQATHNNSSDGYDSQEETLVDKAPMPRPEPLEDEDLEYTSDQDLLQLVSSQNNSTRPTPPDSFEERISRTRTTEPRILSQSKHRSTPTAMSKRPRSRSPEQDSMPQDPEDFDDDSFPEFEVAEDDTAEPVPSQLNDLDLPSPSLSALSEMSVANVNTRAQEKPDMTSAPTEDYALRSPPWKRQKSAPVSTQHVLAMMADADFDEEEDLVWDKENTDPLDTPSKNNSKQATPLKASATCLPESSKKPATPGFGKFDDCEDIFDFDFDTGANDFDDGVDDATLMAMAATQKPKSDVVISARGSPQKLSPMRDAVVTPALIDFPPRTSMPAPPPTSASRRNPTPSKQYHPSKLSESFSSVADEDLLVIADQVEEELSQRRSQKQKTSTHNEQAVTKPATGKSRRRLPWIVNPLPSPNTQDYLLELVEEVEAEREAC